MSQWGYSWNHGPWPCPPLSPSLQGGRDVSVVLRFHSNLLTLKFRQKLLLSFIGFQYIYNNFFCSSIILISCFNKWKEKLITVPFQRVVVTKTGSTPASNRDSRVHAEARSGRSEWQWRASSRGCVRTPRLVFVSGPGRYVDMDVGRCVCSSVTVFV